MTTAVAAGMVKFVLALPALAKEPPPLVHLSNDLPLAGASATMGTTSPAV